MIIVSFIIIFLLLFITLLFAIPAKVKLFFETEGTILDAEMAWLKPILFAQIKAADSKPEVLIKVIGIKLYDKVVTRKQPKKGAKNWNKRDMLSSLSLSDVNIKTAYGSTDPFYTGITSGLLGPFLQYLPVTTLEQTPDFLADESYLKLNADAGLNLGLTIVNLIKTYKTRKAGKLTLQNR